MSPAETARPIRSSRTLAALLAILALAALARFSGLDFGLALPYARPDENRVAGHADRLRDAAGDEVVGPPSFAYPALFPRAIAVVRPLVERLADDAPARPQPAHVTTFRTARLLSAAAGVATVLLLFLLVRRRRGDGEALVAAALLAGCHLHSRDSHFGVTDVPLAFATTAALLVQAITLDWPARRRFLACGAAIGLAAAVKQPAIWLVVPLLVDAFLPGPDVVAGAAASVTRGRIGRAAGGLLLAGLAAALLFLLCNPGAIREPSRFLADNWKELVHKTEGAATFAERGWVTHARFSLREGLGWPFAAAALLGLLLTAWRARRADRVVLLFALAWYVGMGSGTRSFVRYMVPWTPLAALFAARAVLTFVHRLPSPARLPAGLLVTAALLTPSVARLVATDRLLRAPDTRELAADWLSRSLGAEERTLWIDRYAWPFPPGFDSRFDLRDGPALAQAIPSGVAPPDALRGGGWDYVVLADHWLKSPFALPEPVRDALLPALEPVASFGPLADDVVRSRVAPRFDPRDFFFVPFAALEGFVRPGPFLTVYRVLR